MSRVVIIGNAGEGKSTLARKLAEKDGLHHIEIDRLLWQPGWKLTSTEVYNREHDKIIGGDHWIIDGLGQQASIPRRFSASIGNRAERYAIVDALLVGSRSPDRMGHGQPQRCVWWDSGNAAHKGALPEHMGG